MLDAYKMAKDLHPYNTASFTAEYLKEFAPAIRKGSLGFLSIMRPDLLIRVTSEPDTFLPDFGTEAYYNKYPDLQRTKEKFFQSTLTLVANGQINLIPQLAKGIVNEKDISAYLSLVNNNRSFLVKEGYARNLLIYPGTFDPMHYGHRTMIASLLEALGPASYLVVNVNSYQARKPNLETTYEKRLAELEHSLLRSTLINPYRVCAMDFRFGAREGEDHLRQTRLQSYMAGDTKLRWVIGGDKFLSEIERREKEEAQGVIGRTLSRFHLKNMAIYIVPRKGQDRQLFQSLIADLNSTYPAKFVYADEKAYEGSPISSTLIRTYREEDDPNLKAEALRMESSDLTRDYHA